MDYEEKSMTFQFSHSDDIGTTVTTFEVSEAAQWTEVARRFRDFLSSVYGYQVDLSEVE
jgi:hypothetical protein